MDTITALTRQSLIDIAVQSLGDADMAQELAELNGMALTDDVEPGTRASLGSSTRTDCVRRRRLRLRICRKAA